METSFASRVRTFRESKGLAQAAFAERCGLAQGNVSQMEQGTEPKQSNVSKILVGFPDLSPDWLLTGNGPMLRDGRGLTPVTKEASTETRVTTIHPLKLSKLEHLDAEQVSDLIIENVRLKQQLEAAQETITDLKADKQYFKEELRKKPEGNPDAAPFVNPSSTPSMVPSACKPGVQPEATVVDMAAWVARKIEEQTGSVTLVSSDVSAA